MSEDVPDYWSRPFTRPKTMRYGFRCAACLTVDAVEQEDLEVAGVDFLRLEHKCIRCGAMMLVTVTGSHHELKVEPIEAPARAQKARQRPAAVRSPGFSSDRT